MKFFQGEVCTNNVPLNTMAPLFASCPLEQNLANALSFVGVSTDEVMQKASEIVMSAVQRGVLERLKLDFEEALCIAAYTVETKKGPSMYRAMNDILRQKHTKESLLPLWPLLVMFLKALRKLPRVKKNVVYRGVNKDLGEQLQNGTTATWWGFTSTSWDMESTNNFISSNGSLLILDGPCEGYDLHELSEFPTEKELLLEPETRFRIEGRVNMGKTCIQCKIVPCEPVLVSLIPYTNPGSSAAWSPYKQPSAAPATAEAAAPSQPQTLLDIYHSLSDPGLPPEDGIEDMNLKMISNSYGVSDPKVFVNQITTYSVDDVVAIVKQNNRDPAELVFSFALARIQLNENYLLYVPDNLTAVLKELGICTFNGLIRMMQACICWKGL